VRGEPTLKEEVYFRYRAIITDCLH
jgi:hypothetical protein